MSPETHAEPGTGPPTPGRNGIWIQAASLMASLLVRVLRGTMRIRHLGRTHLETLEREGRSYILAFWHGRLLLMPYCYNRRRMAILISRHKDGEYIARTMAWFGHESIRGSTTRGGASALRAAVRHLRRGGDVAVTPDGPRGPRFRVQAGVIQAARLSGAPVVPVAFAARPCKTLQSWDRFLIPLPFARGAFVYGAPLFVPRDADDDGMERLRQQLENGMGAVSAKAEAALGEEDAFRRR